MAISHCHICEKNPDEAKLFGSTGFASGEICPVCQRPTCRHHLVTVRWRWRTPSHEPDSAQICRECRKSYRHRSWDPLHRDWVT